MSTAINTELQAWLCACRVFHLRGGRQVAHPIHSVLGECNFLWFDPRSTEQELQKQLEHCIADSEIHRLRFSIPTIRLLITDSTLHQQVQPWLTAQGFVHHWVSIMCLNLGSLDHSEHEGIAWAKSPGQKQQCLDLCRSSVESTDPLYKAISDRFDEFTEGLNVQWLCKELEGRVVSCLALYNYADNGSLQWINSHPDYRDQGHGSSLIQVALSQLQQQGCHQATLAVHQQNTDAIRLYERLGFSATDRLWLHDRTAIDCAHKYSSGSGAHLDSLHPPKTQLKTKKGI